MITTNINGSAISQAFIDEIRSDSPNVVARLMYNGSILPCDIVDIEVSKGSCGDDEFTIGSVIGDCMTATLKNLDTDIKGNVIDCQIGAFTGADYEYISLGLFTVSQAPRTRYETRVTAYSSVVSETTGLYSIRDSIMGTTLAEVADNVTMLTGVPITFDAGIDTSQILTEPLYGLTIYNVLQVLAVCSGGYVISAHDGGFLVKQFTTATNVTIDTGMMTRLPQIEEEPFTVNTVKCVVSTYGADGQEVSYTTLIDEPLTGNHNGSEVEITTENNVSINVVAPALQADVEITNSYVNRLIFYTNISAIIGYTYSPAEMNITLGDPRLEGCDVIDLIDVDGAHYTVPCHQITHRYANGFTTAVTTAKATAVVNQVGTMLPITAKIEEARQSAIETAENTASLITGNKGGYIVIRYNDENKPEELLILDTPDISSAVNVWRWNQGGLGHSHNGYDGPFDDIAITQDGKINASLITTGTLTADLIKAGTIRDAWNRNSWNLQTGQFTTKQGIIGRFTIDTEGIKYVTTSRNTTLTPTDFKFLRRDYYTETYGYKTAGVAVTYNSNRTPELSFYEKFNTDSIDDLKLCGRIGPYNYFDDGHEGLRFLVGPVGESRTVTFTTYTFAIQSDTVNIQHDCIIYGALDVRGTKSRVSETENYADRRLYAYETPTPLFGDIGETVIGEDGCAYVDIDDIFTETIADKVEYQVFLQKEGEGDCWVAEKTPRYFVVNGTPNLKVAWELKAKQKGYETLRLEPESVLDEYKNIGDDYSPLEDYINEQEGILYDY